MVDSRKPSSFTITSVSLNDLHQTGMKTYTLSYALSLMIITTMKQLIKRRKRQVIYYKILRDRFKLKNRDWLYHS